MVIRYDKHAIEIYVLRSRGTCKQVENKVKARSAKLTSNTED